MCNLEKCFGERAPPGVGWDTSEFRNSSSPGHKSNWDLPNVYLPCVRLCEGTPTTSFARPLLNLLLMAKLYWARTTKKRRSTYRNYGCLRRDNNKKSQVRTRSVFTLLLDSFLESELLSLLSCRLGKKHLLRSRYGKSEIVWDWDPLAVNEQLVPWIPVLNQRKGDWLLDWTIWIAYPVFTTCLSDLPYDLQPYEICKCCEQIGTILTSSHKTHNLYLKTLPKNSPWLFLYKDKRRIRSPIDS